MEPTPGRKEEWQPPESSEGRLRFWIEDGAANLGAPPADTFWTRVVGGWLGPVVLAAIGVQAVLLRTVSLRERYSWAKVDIKGPAAVAGGLALISIAVYVHFYCYWSRRSLLVGGVGMMLSGVAAGILLVAFMLLAMSG